MSNTAIEYVDRTWPVVSGCSGKVSTGCKECWAEWFAKRQGRDFRQVELCDDKVLWAPERWRNRSTVFVAPMGDLFDPAVPDRFIRDVFLAIWRAPRQQFLVLTKRSERMRNLVNNGAPMRLRMPNNVALGVSVENQETADERLAHLLAARCKLRWVSYEPALGPVDFRALRQQRVVNGPTLIDALAGVQAYPSMTKPGAALDWVVIGGESARPPTKARPINVEWFYRTLQDCRRAGVPIYIKQLGSAHAVHAAGQRPIALDPRAADPQGWAPALRVREHLRWPAAEEA